MLGRTVEPKAMSSRAKDGEILLNVNNLSMKDGLKDKFHDISFNLKAGEILGITGLVGAGRTELARVIFGAERKENIFGNISLFGKKYFPTTPRGAVKKGMALAPEDRKQQGLVLGRPISDNVVMAVNDRLKRGVFLDHKKRNELIVNLVRRLDIRTSDTNLRAETLSGGNQQKVVLAKWLATNAGVLILDQPTAGIDVGTKDEIYRLLDDLASRGAGIIVISDDPEELSRVSDRILVMRKGKIITELREAMTSAHILEAITGEAAS
jgi:ABC-type sugar transport system ATPase subunit